MPADHDTRPLGRTGIHMLPLGIGTNKWRRADRGAVLETFRTIHDAGPCMIDTAEIYFSERVVGDCLRVGPTRAVIASKFLPFPGRTSPRRLMSALGTSLARLGLKTIDLYYVHYPLPLIDVGVFAEGLVEAVKSVRGETLRCPPTAPAGSETLAFASSPHRDNVAYRRHKPSYRSVIPAFN